MRWRTVGEDEGGGEEREIAVIYCGSHLLIILSSHKKMTLTATYCHVNKPHQHSQSTND